MSHRALRNPAPTEAMKAGAYYHGTTKEARAEKIATQGIQPRSISLAEPGGRGKLKPVVGRVYLTPDVSYAMIYALGGQFAGSTMPKHMVEDYGLYGYLFVVRGSDLRDVEPDEDSVGEAIHHAYEVVSQHKGAGAHASAYTGNKLWTNLRQDEQFSAELAYFASRVITPKQVTDLRNGYYSAWASAGKRALKKLSDAQKLKLVAYGAHVAHGGAVMPSEAWRIDRRLSPKLKSDGSNFFQVAEKLPWHPTEPTA